jgi:putative DNA methylase
MDVSAEDASCLTNPCGWRSRGYLPHFEGGPIPQSITFRLIDSLPTVQMREWAAELVELPIQQAENERRRRIEEYLDKGAGELWLSQDSIAELVEQPLLCFDGQRYRLHAWVVMPNHVHVLITPQLGHELSQILHSWKSFTAKKANRLLGRTGAFWQQEYFDRFVRHEEHFEDALKYIEFNPVKAGLCKHPESWQFSSASWRPSSE